MLGYILPRSSKVYSLSSIVWEEKKKNKQEKKKALWIVITQKLQ